MSGPLGCVVLKLPAEMQASTWKGQGLGTLESCLVAAVERCFTSVSRDESETFSGF